MSKDIVASAEPNLWKRWSMKVLSNVFAPLPSSKVHSSYWLVYLGLVTPIRLISFISTIVFTSSTIHLLQQIQFNRTHPQNLLSNGSDLGGFGSKSLTLFSLFHGQRFLYFRRFIYIWTTVETFFNVYYFMKKRQAQFIRSPPPFSEQKRMELFTRCLENISEGSGPNGCEAFILRWFYEHDHNDKHFNLTYQDVQTWLIWAFFSKLPYQMNKNEWDQADQMMTIIQTKIKTKLIKSDNNNDNSNISDNIKKCVRNTLDPVTSISRPFVYYGVISVADYLLGQLIHLYNFKKLNIGLITYWIYTPPNSQNQTLDEPIVFIHGIGAGLGAYFMFLIGLVKKFGSNRKIICPCLSHVSMKISEHVPSRVETLWALESIYAKHEISHAVVIGHSMGSVVLSWLIKERPHQVSKSIFIDPVVFKLWEVDVAFNFLYRNPTTGFDLLMYYFVSKEMFISRYLHRDFFWFENVIFPNHDQLPKSTKVFISQSDAIIPNPLQIQNYLNSHNIQTQIWPGFNHGQFLFESEAIKDIIQYIQEP